MSHLFFFIDLDADFHNTRFTARIQLVCVPLLLRHDIEHNKCTRVVT